MTTEPVGLPSVGEPGTAAEFQLERLREWGLGDLADERTSREQALIVHHCALYVRNVWREMHGEQAEPDPAAVRACVGRMVGRPEMLERAERLISAEAAHDDWAADMTADAGLYDAVAAALGGRAAT